VGIIQLDCDLLGKLAPSTLGLLEPADNIIQGGSNPEVLLLQSKLLTTVEVVVGVKDGANRLSSLLIGHRTLVVTTVELLEVKLAAGSLTGPQTHVIGCGSVEPWNWHIISNGFDDFTTFPNCDVLSDLVLVFSDTSVELDLDIISQSEPRKGANTYINHNIMPGEFPRIEVKPVIWNLNLVPIHDFLLEDTISISQTVAPGRVV